ncbi:MAG: hypothetical protein FD143_512 [Ignavibacteria bacterium]|nr:MAG: hypothetical protein FD143_512 [Ignavibacteria bacterium]KAF0161583.1 MAG: hypothetical protein FD188_700 [Ignavibacteria bacterium]
MKSKFLVTVLVIFIFSKVVNAQLLSSFGMKIGVANAGQSWDYSGDLTTIEIFDKSRIGFAFGVYTEWFDLPLISIIAEAHYIQKGSKGEIIVATMDSPAGTGETKTITPRIDYLSMPLLAKLRYETNSFTVYGIAGPRIDILIGKNSEAVGSVFDDFKYTDIGGTFGFGFEIPITEIYFASCELRYSPSFQNIFSNGILEVKNRSLEFLVVFGHKLHTR